jgi:hypothetical protein
MKPSTLRDGFGPISAIDDLSGIVIGIGLWIFVLVAAPLLVIVLAGLLFPLEVSLLATLAVLIVVARLAGIVPWVIGIVNEATGEERTELSRNLVHVSRRVREINGGGGVPVHWSWS